MNIDKMIEDRIYAAPATRYGRDLRGFVELKAAGRSVAAYVRKGDSAKKTIVYLHGNGEDLVSCGYGHTDRFEKMGYTVAAVDYPGYGLSEGPFSEDGCYENAHSLYDYLVGPKCGIRPEDIIVIGCSLGSASAVELASSAKVGGLVLEVAFYSGRRIAKDMADKVGLGFLKPMSGLIRKFPSDEHMAKVTCPVLSIHGTADELVPFKEGRDLYELAANKYRFVEVPGASHCGFIDGLGGERYAELIVGFADNTGV